MVAALVLLQVQTNAPIKQPKTIEACAYQSVEHALPDGAPDPNAPDNTYLYVTAKWTLIADTNQAPADSDGTRMLVLTRKTYPTFEWYTESGKASKALDALFTQVSRPSTNTFARMTVGTITTQDQSQPIYKGNRGVHLTQTITQDTVEVHTLGRKRVMRTYHREGTGIFTTLVGANDIVDPSKQPFCIRDNKPEVRVEPTKYTY